MDNSKVDKAVECFEGNCNCCQSMILIYGPQYGLTEDVGLRLGTGFAGGLARHGEVCGAVAGAIMVIGLSNGMTSEEDMDRRDKTYELVNEFIKRFKKNNSSIKCRDLLGCDLSTQEGREKAKSEGLFETLCPKFVKTSAEILEEII